MPTPIVDVDAFTSPVTTPSNGEVADEAAWLASMQQLADRTRNNKNRLDAVPTLLADQIMARASAGVTEGKASSDVSLGLIALQTIIAHADALATKSSDIESASTTNLGTATGVFAHITGTATIEAFGTVGAGILRALLFEDVLTLTHNAVSLILPTASNIVTLARDTALVVSEGSGNWRVLVYQRADGSALVGGGSLQDSYNGGATISKAIGTPIGFTNVVDAGPLLTLSHPFAGVGNTLDINHGAVSMGIGVKITHAGASGAAIDADVTGPGATPIDLKISGTSVFKIDSTGAVAFDPPTNNDFLVTALGTGSAALATVDGLALLAAFGSGDVQLAAIGGGAVLIDSVMDEVKLSHVGGVARAQGDMVVDGHLIAAQGFVGGLHIANDGVTPDEIIDIDPGKAISDDSTIMIEALATLSPDITVAGAGGLDTDTVGPSLLYAVYVIADSAGVNPVSSLFSLSFTVGGIAFPVGYDRARRIATVRTDSTSDIETFQQPKAEGRARWVYFKRTVQLQAAGTASSFTDTATSASASVPTTATRQQVAMELRKTGAGEPDVRVEIVPDGWDETAGAQVWSCRSGLENGTADTFTSNTVEMPVGPMGLIRYRVLPATDGLADVYVRGYEDSI